VKQQTKTLFVWLVLLVGVLVLAHLFTQSQRVTQRTYSDFVADVTANAGDFEETVLEVDVYKNHVNITYEQEGAQYEVLGPAADELYSLLNEKGVDYKIDPKESSEFLQIAVLWIPMLLIGVLVFVFMRQMQSGGGKAMTFGKSRARLLNEHTQKVTFKDVAGIEEAREECEEIIDFLRDTRKYLRVGGRIPKGVLLMGPPGTGKTLLARAIAGEAGVNFFSISGSDFVEMFVGVGASRVRDLFEQGKKNAPCIIFIDEIDAVGRHRGAGLGGGHDEREQTLNQLLVEMDGFESNDGVILVAATNRPDVLDPALLRPGRFDRRIMVGLPDMRGRASILKVHTRKVPTGDDVDFERLAHGTPGFSGADLENLVNEAALLAARNDRDRVLAVDFERAKDKVMMGAERRNAHISEHEKKVTAWHEAGHTMIAKLLPKGTIDPVHKVSIIPRGRALGVTHLLPEQERLSLSAINARAMICMLMGGRIAEEIAFDGQKTTGAGDDLTKATKIARKMVCEWGMSERLGPLTFGAESSEPFLGRDMGRRAEYSEATARAIDEEIQAIVRGEYQRAHEMLESHADDLARVAAALIERESLGAEQIELLLSGGTLPALEPVVKADKVTPTAETRGSDTREDRDEHRAPTGMPLPEPG
jgi:cell division protease FtsH